MEDPEKVTIGTNHTQNTTDTPSEKNFNREECGDIVDDEVYDDQDKGGDIVDNRPKAPPSQVTIGDNHTQLSAYAPFNKNCDQEKGGEIDDYEVDDDDEKVGDIADDEGHDDQEKCGEIVDN